MEWTPYITAAIFISSAATAVSAATNCPDAAEVVVASVFTTLGIVIIVLVIVGCFIWKRRRDISKPELSKNEDGNDSSASSPNSKHGFSNPAFEKDPELGGKGESVHVQSMKNTFDHAKPNCIVDLDWNKKTWSSLPGDRNLYRTSRRRSSCGPLDRNTYPSGADDTTEVWLTSQDFIGLGFNIAGSMRDGIFVSQVHNRGPAKESGKFAIGDRIISVSISFENMVYEDALTILSYASPYHVKISLRKQENMSKNKNLNEVKTNLNHPMYRSHSVDAFIPIHKNHSLNKKRYASEVRRDKKESPEVERADIYRMSSNVLEENMSNDSSGGNIAGFERLFPKKQVDALVHAQPSSEQVQFNFEREIVTKELSADNFDLNYNIKNHDLTDSSLLPVDSSFTEAFGDLSDQDKMDVLRLSYADPCAIETETVSCDLKSVPIKPERKNKRSSTTSSASQSDSDLSSSMPGSPVSAYGIDVFQKQLMLPPNEPPPPVPEEIHEELITAEIHQRGAVINSDNIILETMPIKNVQNLGATMFVVHDLFDIDSDEDSVKDSVNKSLKVYSDDRESVVEETILAKQIKMNNIELFPSQKLLHKNKMNISNSVSSESSTEEVEVSDKCDDKCKTLQIDSDPLLDMNLNFDTDFLLFKESYPSRNTKYFENGIAYDISVTELQAMENKALMQEQIKAQFPKGKGGIAFELRDDIITGETKTVPSNNVYRTSSYNIMSTEDCNHHKDISHRATSWIGESIHIEPENGVLDWSGKRLVRSVPFTEIPQSETNKDWTERQWRVEDENFFDSQIKQDAKSTHLQQLTQANISMTNSEKDNNGYGSDSLSNSTSEDSTDTKEQVNANVVSDESLIIKQTDISQTSNLSDKTKVSIGLTH